MKIRNKAISDLITIVILILVTITMAGMIYVFVVPMIEENMEKTQKCFDVKLEILAGEDTCYDAIRKEIKIEIARGEKDVELTGIQILISGREKIWGGVIRNNTVTANVREYAGSYNNVLSLPGKSEARVYVINANAINVYPENVAVTPIIKLKDKEKMCTTSFQSILNPC
ncbi:MAG: hypothetical protein QW041_03090 [Candidatus Pacearchaeota archaeon]